MATLEELRSQVDEVDDEIVTLLRRRINIVKEVAELKKREAPGKFPLRPGREAKQIRAIMEKLKTTGFAPAAGAAMWRSIIMASLLKEGEVSLSVSAGAGHEALFWLGREYFGNFLPVIKQNAPKRVIGDLLDKKAAIGVLPVLSNDDKDRWWTDMLDTSREMPKIFARLPFVMQGAPARDAAAAVAVGFVEPEETGDDVSLYVFEVGEDTSHHKLQTALAKAKLDATWIEVVSPTPVLRQHVVEIKGFVTPEDKRYKSFAAELGGALLHQVWLGSYAVPVVLN